MIDEPRLGSNLDAEPLANENLKFLENIEVEFKKYLTEKNLGMGKLLPAFRISLTGLSMGPSLFDIASLIGKEETIYRIEKAIKILA